jgi:predicted ATP-grasp superfamily ATP-dependent carboligase
MRVFLYEYTCAAPAAGEPLAPSLRAEGWAMLSAVADDLNRVPGVETVALLGEGCPPCAGAARYLSDPTEERERFRELAGAADWSLVIAPEFDGLLARRCRWVMEAGGRLLGPSPARVELAADKLRLADVLQRQGVPTPPCHPATVLAAAGQTVRFPAVLKPRDGAGSQATCLVPARAALPDCLQRMHAERPRAEMLLQPFVPGRPVSVAFLIGPGQEVALPPAGQHLTRDGRFRYLGGTVSLEPEPARRAVALGRRAVRAVPDLRGYVGVDLVLGDAADGSEDQVIEINPRLTTSYVGLRALARDNLAGALLRVARGEAVELGWHPGPVHFRADGNAAGGPESRTPASGRVETGGSGR